MRDDRKTFLAVKLRSSRFGRDVWQLSLIVLAGAALLGLLGVLQWAVCQRDHPGRPLVECIRRR